MAELTPRQRCFVEEYLIDLNATAAARRAGYSDRSANSYAHILLKRPAVAAAVVAAQAERSERTRVTQDRVIAEYARLAFADIRRFVEWGPDGVALKASDGLDDEEARCVAEVYETRTQHGGSRRVKLHDKKGALDSLARHLGMFAEKAGGEGPREFTIVFAEEEESGAEGGDESQPPD